MAMHAAKEESHSSGIGNTLLAISNRLKDMYDNLDDTKIVGNVKIDDNKEIVILNAEGRERVGRIART